MNRYADEEIDSSGHSYPSRRRPDLDADLEAGADREISLGTPTILGIFFALSLVCACFFGFGYTLGRRSVPVTPAVVQTVATNGAAKPTAASVSAVKSPEATASTVIVPSDAPVPTPSHVKSGINPADGAIVGDKLPATTSAPAPAQAGSVPDTGFMVQVAAVSSQDVADIELAALAKKGYSVAVHHEPQDKLLHIQIGPFATRKEADAMRARVLADGFNAIVK